MGSAQESPVSINDFSDKCRICLKSYSSMTDIFESGISHKVTELINIKITSNDKLPKNMCQDCSKQLDEFCKFQNLAKDSDKFLKALLLAEQSYNRVTAKSRIDRTSNKKSKLNKSCRKRNDSGSDKIYLLFVTGATSDSSPKSEILIRDLDIDNGNIELTDFCRSLIKNGSENPIYLNKKLKDYLFQVKDSFQLEAFATENHDKNVFNVNMFIYTCYECKESFESEDCLTEHLLCCQNIRTSQEVFNYECPVCTKCESDKHLFLNHLNNHKEEGISFIKVDKNLDSVFLTESEEEIFIDSKPHTEEKSNMRRKILKINVDCFKCYFCSELKSADDIMKHIQLCIPCFQEDDYFSVHIKYYCPVCSATWVDDAESYNRHLLSHSEDGIYFIKVDISGQLAELTAEDTVYTPFERALEILTFNGDESSVTNARLVKMRGLFSCLNCDYEGDSLDLLLEHYLEIHDGMKPTSYVCPVCDKEFKLSDLGKSMPYQIHMRKHKEDGIYFLKVNADGAIVVDDLDNSGLFSDINDFLYGKVPCPELELIENVYVPEAFLEKIPHSEEGYVRNSSSRFSIQEKEDKEESKGSRNYICEKCGKKCFGKGNYKRHFLTHSDGTQFSLQKRPKCSVCDKTFSNRAALNEHSKHHRNEQAQVEDVPDLTRAVCEICGKRLSNKASLAKHSKIHANSRENEVFKCSVCERRFRREPSLKRHLSAHFNPNYFECEECKLPLPSLASLGRHKLAHQSSSNTYDCKVCKISFLTKERLTAHETHTGHHQNQKRFECNVCHEKFFVGREFIKHIKLHPKYKMSECTLCGKRLSTMQSLGLHLSRHFESNSILCPQCGKQCFEERNYRRHLLTHKGVKPFRCDVEGCDKSFYTYFEVNRHKKYHNNTRDFSCPYCPKSFHEANHLKVHIRTHTGERPYTCPHCGKSFVTRTRCKQHISLIHQGIGYDLIQSNISKKVPVFEALETVA